MQGEDAVVFVLSAGRQPGHPEGKQQDENRGREAEGAHIGFPGPQPAAEGQEMQKFVAQIDEGAAGPEGEDQGFETETDFGFEVDEQVDCYHRSGTHHQIRPRCHVYERKHPQPHQRTYWSGVA